MESQPDPEVFSRNILTTEERCSKHEREMISYYCRTHHMLGCSTCIALNHGNCLLGYIPDIVNTEDIAEELNAIETELDTVLNNIEEKTQQIGKNIELIDSAHNALVKELKQIKDGMISAVDESATNAQAEIDDLKDQDKENMNEATELCSEALKKLNEFKSKRKQLQSDGKRCQLFIQMHKFKTEVLALYEAIDALSTKSKVELGLKNCNLESEGGVLPKILLQKKGSASERANIPGEAHRKPELKMVHLVILLVAVAITMLASLPNQNPNDHVKQFDLDHLGVIDTRLTTCKHLRMIVMSREILATSNMLGKIFTFNTSSGHFMKEENSFNGTKYISRDVVRKNETHLISFREYNAQFGNGCYISGIQIGHNLINIQHYKGSCKGITIVNDNLALLSSKSDIQEITIIDIKFNRTIKIDPINAELTHIHVSHDNLAFFLIEELTGSIVKLDFNGKLMASYRNLKLLSPIGLSVDSDGFVYVIGFGSQNIHRVTSDLKYVQIIPLNFQPISIAFGKALNRLYVGSYGCGIYTIDIPQ